MAGIKRHGNEERGGRMVAAETQGSNGRGRGDGRLDMSTATVEIW